MERKPPGSSTLSNQRWSKRGRENLHVVVIVHEAACEVGS